MLDIQYHAGVDGFTDNANNYHASASVNGASITVSPASGVPILSVPGQLLLGAWITLVGVGTLKRRRANG